jgi:hypothetical protein
VSPENKLTPLPTDECGVRSKTNTNFSHYVWKFHGREWLKMTVPLVGYVYFLKMYHVPQGISYHSLVGLYFTILLKSLPGFALHVV